MFEIGDKVICIDDMKRPEAVTAINKLFVSWVKKGEEYTIRAIDDNEGIVTGILLEEIVNPMVYIELLSQVKEPMFASWRFRKLKTEYIENFEFEHEYR